MVKYLSAKEIMERTGLGKGTVYNLLNRQDFPAVHIGKRILVSEQDFEAWMRRGGTEQKGT